MKMDQGPSTSTVSDLFAFAHLSFLPFSQGLKSFSDSFSFLSQTRHLS